MSEQSPPPSAGSDRRRSSFTEMFIPRPSSGTQGSSYSPPNANTSASMGSPQNHRRGMSITTLGLGGNSPTNPHSPLNAFAKQRRASVASSSASGSPEFRNSFEDSAISEEDHQSGLTTSTPVTPSFARRVSFGAQALRDVRNTGGASGGRRPSLFATLPEQPENDSSRNDLPSSSKAATGGGSRGLFLSPFRLALRLFVFDISNFNVALDQIRRTDGSLGEGFNWSEALRDRTKRQPSISASNNPFQHRHRASSTTIIEPPKEMPKPIAPPVAAKLMKPDQLGERMLRGDFMMD